MNPHQCIDQQKKVVVDYSYFDPAALNRQGVSWLLFGGNHEAVTSFKNALVTMKSSLYQVPPDQQDHDRSATAPATPSSKYASIELPNEEDRFYIYSRALVFTSHRGGVISEADYPLYSALILFNIALAHHLRAQRGPKDRALKDAAYFYSMCLQLLAAVELRSPKSISAPIKLAALNNLAVIHYEEGDARRAHSVLKGTFDLLSPAYLGLGEDGGEAFDQDDFDGITLNAVMMKWTFVAPCA